MITSVKNETIKTWAKLKIKKYRDQLQLFLIEGEHLVEEALNSDWELTDLIVSEHFQLPQRWERVPVTYVAENVLQHLAYTKSPQGIMAVVKMKQMPFEKHNRLLLLDAIQDPGNVGTMIRTADAAGFDGVILGEGTVDLYNDKVIRSSQGSLFHLPIMSANLIEQISVLQQQGVAVLASTLDEAIPIHTVEHREKMALIVGNEGSGVDPALLSKADNRVHIPIYGQAESLNVSVATGILIYRLIEK
ncbi:TrmH family RNA methyltransferase [Amphibacillus sediminis]|uniref:TrmH family RNA methyltransferase n=1 Tax=Amphibacillus sediminis TaxID=360185 RepID=UPI0008325392|nr:RNA methyltransferase [Amphibacillus sediminis]